VYCLSTPDQEYIDKIIKQHFDTEVTISCKSIFDSSVVFRPSFWTSSRFCFEFNALNKITKKDSYPLPPVEAVVRNLSGYKFY